MSIRTISGLVGAGMLVVGCYGSPEEEEEPLAATESEIVGGSIDRGDNAVAFVSFKNGYCTGTLIAPNVILTAGHCSVVDESCNGGGGPAKCQAIPASAYTVSGGTVLRDRTGRALAAAWEAKVLENHPHPSYGSLSGGLLHDDVAVLILDTIKVNTGTAPKPVPWLSTKNDKVFADGTRIRAVGFGITNHRLHVGGGSKRQVGLTIRDQSAIDFTYGSARGNTCNGDSGGPAFAMINGVETLIGTTSTGDYDCVREGTNMRVDTLAPFIRQFTDKKAP